MKLSINKNEVLIIGIVSLVIGFTIPFLFFSDLVEKNNSFLPWQSIFTSFVYTFSYHPSLIKFIGGKAKNQTL